MFQAETNRFIHSSYAHSLAGVLQKPANHFLTDAPSASLPTSGGLIANTKENLSFSIGSSEIVKIGRASSKVLGEYSRQSDEYISLATATIEKLNILDVVTADRIVAKVTSVYPRTMFEGIDYHPARFSISGSHFDNLRINGEPIDCRFAKQEPSVPDPTEDLRNFQTLCYGHSDDRQKDWKNKLSDLRTKFKDDAAALKQEVERLQGDADEKLKGKIEEFEGNWIKGKFDKLPKSGIQSPFYARHSERHHGCIFKERSWVIPVEQFGKVHLGEISVYGGKVILNMLRVELGCPDSGSVGGPTACTNGTNTKPGS